MFRSLLDQGFPSVFEGFKATKVCPFLLLESRKLVNEKVQASMKNLTQTA
jgi:hypothetical protein